MGSKRSKTIKVAVIFGTRPEITKLAPVIDAMEKYPEQLQSLVIATAQHRELLDQELAGFGIRPHYDLNLMRKGQGLVHITSSVLEDLDRLFAREKPDFVLVQGDTTTTFAAALAAYYHQIPIGHVEAGLRTGDKYRPFPEEINRRLVGCMADYHFAPTERARQNLLHEGVPEKRIWVTGNTAIDALFFILARTENQTNDFAGLDDLIGANGKVDPQARMILVTAHRRENFGKPMWHLCQAIRQITETFADVEIVFSVHPNPRVRELVYQELADHNRIHLIEPPAYARFVHLMRRSYLILTDSGGIQEEAPSLGKPVLVLRDKTERVEALEAGTARLVGTDPTRITEQTAILLSDAATYQRMAQTKNPFGDGRAASQIVTRIIEFFA